MRDSIATAAATKSAAAPKIEAPQAFREMADSFAHPKESYEKMSAATAEASNVIQNACSTAAQSALECNAKVIEFARTNSNAAFDLFGQLLTAKSYAEVVEKTTAYMRTQFDTVTAQAKELAEHAQQVATKTAEPLKESFTTTFNKAA